MATLRFRRPDQLLGHDRFRCGRLHRLVGTPSLTKLYGNMAGLWLPSRLWHVLERWHADERQETAGEAYGLAGSLCDCSRTILPQTIRRCLGKRPFAVFAS